MHQTQPCELRVDSSSQMSAGFRLKRWGREGCITLSMAKADFCALAADGSIQDGLQVQFATESEIFCLVQPEQSELIVRCTSEMSREDVGSTYNRGRMHAGPNMPLAVIARNPSN